MYEKNSLDNMIHLSSISNSNISLAIEIKCLLNSDYDILVKHYVFYFSLLSNLLI